LGCVLYRLLTGSVPYTGSTMAAAIHGHLMRPVPRPTALVPWLSPALDDVVARAMAKDPAERFASCRDLATAARRALDDFPPVPDPPYVVTLIPGAGTPAAVVGPIGTDALPPDEAGNVIDLIRRIRFFDLPETWPAAEEQPVGTPVTIEVGCSAATRRVTFDLTAARRPPQIDDLVTAMERLPSSVGELAPPAKRPVPATVVPTRPSASRPSPPPDDHSAQSMDGRSAGTPAATPVDPEPATEPPLDRPPSDRWGPEPETPVVREPRRSSIGPDGPDKPAERAAPHEKAPTDEARSDRHPHRRTRLLVAGAVLMIMAAVVVVWTVLTANVQTPKSDPPAGSPQPDPTTPATASAPGLADLYRIVPLHLEAPPFGGQAPSPPDTAGLTIMSQEPNQITDDDVWVRENQLSLPGDLRPFLQPAEPFPADVPAIYRGSSLARVLQFPEATFLLYGDRNEPFLLVAVDPTSKEVRYAFDFERYTMAPELVESDRPYVYQAIRWVRQVDNVLYVSTGHRTYSASSFGKNAYITAIDITSGHVLWRSPALVANSNNFEIMGDRIITGYGFTSEPDWLYVLDRGTGTPIGALELSSGPEYIIPKDGLLFVRCYDMNYVIRP
jgi:hypothetical protein